MFSYTIKSKIKYVLYPFLLSTLLSAQIPDNNNARHFRETPDTSLLKAVPDDELPELFDKKIQSVVAATPADSVDTEINGFRVQIYKTETLADSKEKQTLYSEMFGEQNIKLVFEEPFYKIRVGNFRTRNEAENYQDELLRSGFRSTIVVPDRVTLRIARKK